jgi:isocitrate dehydrogenase kinase/phosphatase
MNGNVRPDEAAAMIADGFDELRAKFIAITRRARGRFERREWSLGQRDAAERIGITHEAVEAPVSAARRWLRQRWLSRDAWREVKRAYRERSRDRADAELAETFFNSVTRRVLGIVGIDTAVEFSEPTPLPLSTCDEQLVLHTFEHARGEPTRDLIERVLRAQSWNAPYADLPEDARLAGIAIDCELERLGDRGTIVRLEMLRPVFFRNKGAYLVGRIVTPAGHMPLILALVHRANGIILDAVLLTADDASIVFGFSRSYFQADIDYPAAVVAVLSSIMPRKRVDELYTSIGHHKHGKRELYRTLMQELEKPDTRFERAAGDEGLVMSVFTLPSLSVVLKVIKDTFGQPKRITRDEVRAKYQFVFVRDRVGRLADAQEFEHLEFPANRFAPGLLEKLRSECARTIQVNEGNAHFAHLYTERRVVPLNLFLRSVDPSTAQAAILDFGRAIKELAASNIFTGDMLTKNFGLTRHGRVICYDYDELLPLLDCRFRRIPPPVDLYEEMSAEPYFSIGEHDVFPEEFGPFLVPMGSLGSAFTAKHADLLTLEFWQGAQERLRTGEIDDVFPYADERRLRR